MTSKLTPPAYKLALATALLQFWSGENDADWWWLMAHDIDDDRGRCAVPSIYA